MIFCSTTPPSLSSTFDWSETYPAESPVGRSSHATRAARSTTAGTRALYGSSVKVLFGLVGDHSPFHPLNGQRLTVLFTQHKRTGLYFVCEVDGRRRVTVAQEWTDRGVPASTDRLAVEGLTAARELAS